MTRRASKRSRTSQKKSTPGDESPTCPDVFSQTNSFFEGAVSLCGVPTYFGADIGTRNWNWSKTPGSALYTHHVQLSYRQEITRLVCIESKTVYRCSGRPHGQASLSSIIGHSIQLADFYSPERWDSCAQPQGMAFVETTTEVAAQPTKDNGAAPRYVASGCRLRSHGYTEASSEIAISEGASLEFEGLIHTDVRV